MRKTIFIFLLGLTTISCSTDTKQTSENVSEPQQNMKHINKDLTVVEFADLMTNTPGQVLDVRTPEEWAEGTLKNAIKMNFFDDNFSVQLQQLDKNKAVYVYCKSGGRSGKAKEMMKEMGFTTVYNLDGGMAAWAGAGMETVQ
ncbi:MAG: rhodanese-like domain-containing protein [Vicingaceae bacterium]|nr:rhodanese-like domain-containing protein [Vicingaceae bacterium]